jgi:prepilin-type N-terminal cleavage/methylation domain-containing protein
MSNKLKELRAKEGFTIIEVIIVLVIGAVIMLAVFLVVPQLQRTQRNARQQDNARRALAGIQQFASNNNNTFPTAAQLLQQTGTLTNPVGNTDLVAGSISIGAAGSSTASTPSAGNLVIFNGATCTNTPGITAAATNSYAVIVGTEPANTSYCVNIK